MIIAAVVLFLVSYAKCAQSRASDESTTIGTAVVNSCTLDPYSLMEPRIIEHSAAEGSSCCGYQQNKDEYPWIVSVLKDDMMFGERKEIYICSGSLIHPKVVLTAANCILSAEEDNLMIRGGQNFDYSDDRYDRQVLRSVIHEHYERRGLVNNIALLFLTEPFEINNNVNTICLPPPNEINLQRCFVSKWKREMVDGRNQTYLKTVELPMVDREKCIMGMRKTRFGRNYELHKSFICAGGEIVKDTCEADGDVGAPLVCPIPGTAKRYHQIGMISWGFGLGNSLPGVYVNVPQYVNWINEQLTR